MSWALPTAATVFGNVASLGLRATLPLAFAAFACATFARRSAALRRLLWISAFGAVALLPFIPAVVSFPAIDTGTLREALRALRPSVADAAGPSLRAPFSSAPMEGGEPPSHPGSVEARPPLATVAAGGVALWAIVALVLSLRLGYALRRRRKTRCDSEPPGGEWLVLLDQLGAAAGLRVTPRLGQSPEVGTAQTWGVTDPIILLPEHSRLWSEERRRVVLFHEIVHVAHRDSAILVATRFLCGLLWFNPIMWFAHRRLRLDVERACDDQVLTLTGRPERYARELVGMARLRGSVRGAPETVVALIRPRELELRIAAILDSRNLRGRSPLPATLLGASLLTMVTFLAGAVRPERSEPPLVLAGPMAYRWIEENVAGQLQIIDVSLEGVVRISPDSTEVVGIAPGGKLTVVQMSGAHRPIQSMTYGRDRGRLWSEPSPSLAGEAARSWSAAHLPAVARMYAFSTRSRAAGPRPLDPAFAWTQAEQFHDLYLEILGPLLDEATGDLGIDGKTRLRWHDEISALLYGRLSLTVTGTRVAVTSENGSLGDVIASEYLARLDRSGLRPAVGARERLARALREGGARLSERWSEALTRGGSR